MATCNASSLLAANPFTRLDKGLQEACKLQLLCDISAGGGGGGTIGGSGTAGKLAKFTAGTTLGDSIVTEAGTTISVGGSLDVASSGSLGWTDVLLWRNAANVLSLRNGTNAQTFLVNNTYTSTTNYERGFLSWVSNEFRIGTQKGSGGGSVRDLAFYIDGTRHGFFTTFGGRFYFAVNQQGYLGFHTRCYASSPADGVLLLQNNGLTDFNRLQFGGTTSSFPALKRSTTTLQARLADDSDFADFSCEQIRTNNGVFHVSDVALTDGAAAQIGTLTNAPAAGNPTKWIPINDNGTTRYIPCW